MSVFSEMSSHRPLGQHLISEMRGARNLEDPARAAKALEAAAHAAGAHVLDVRTHDFGDRSGFTGVALLAESHISVHTWPEHSYAAIDIFMCGSADPAKSLDVLKAYFAPTHCTAQLIARGIGLSALLDDQPI